MVRHVVLDTNVAVLLAVGLTDAGLITQHRRLDAYDRRDLAVLEEAITFSAGLVWCPHVLAETSNLARDIHKAAADAIGVTLGRLIATYPEEGVPSAAGVMRREYAYLGLTDAVLIRFAELGSTVITHDGPLHAAILAAGFQSIHFEVLRAERRAAHRQD